MSPILSVALFVAAIGELCGAAVWNGQPFFFPDTSGYIRGADAAFANFLGLTSDWTEGAGRVWKDVGGASSPAALSAGSAEGPVVVSGRSPFYGILLYLRHVTGGFWLSVAAQAGLIALAVIFTLRHLFGPAGGRSVLVLVVLVATTPISFFVSLLMPDILAGLTILAAANLIVLFRDMRRWEAVFWGLLLIFTVVSHISHLLVGAGLCTAGAVLAIRERRRWGGVGVLALTVVIGIGAEISFSGTVAHVTGNPPQRAPHLTVRLLSDGPGYAYAKNTVDNKLS